MPTENATMFDQVAEVIERLRPFLLRDGGDCTLVDVEDGIVKLQLHGALSLIHISEPTRQCCTSRMPSSA